MPKVDPLTKQRIVEKAILINRVENRLLELYSKGQIAGTLHTCLGQEFSATAICETLKAGDVVFSGHRCHGHFLAHTNDVSGLLAELLGKKDGICGGKGGSQHLCGVDFFSNGVQGGIVPIAAGLALARKLKRKNSISVVFIGDGTLGEGVVYETFNLASKWSLPLLIVLENNQIAQSTPTTLTLAGTIEDRGKAFGIDCQAGNTWDWESLYLKAKKLVESVRADSRPRLLIVDTFRLGPHSKGDDTRPLTEIEPFRFKDPVTQFLKKPTKSIAEFLKRTDLLLDDLVEKCQLMPSPELETEEHNTRSIEWANHRLPDKLFGQDLNLFFKKAMKADSKVLFIGEDVLDPYGGAFKISKDLSTLFPNQVFTTPISEAAIVGLGTGLAIEGYRPFVEIMFGDFLGLAFDQILNHAAKFNEMYDGKVFPHLAIRTPMGGGRGYGPTHSQSIEKHFLGIPGLRVIAPNYFLSADLVYEPLVKMETGISLIIENKVMYSSELGGTLPIGFQIKISNELFPTVHIAPISNTIHFTIIGYGGMTKIILSAMEVLFHEYDIICQAIFPTQIYPFQVDSILPIVQRAKNVFIVEEGQGFASFASEVISQLAVKDLGLKFARTFSYQSIVPASSSLEEQVLPSVDSVVAIILESLGVKR